MGYLESDISYPTERDELLPVPVATASDEQPLRVLFVEDSRDNRMLVMAYLRDTPYQMDIAEDGAIATRMFMSGSYDIVLMDMQMPVLDGYSATRAIRKWEEAQGRAPTPIIALTASASMLGRGQALGSQT